MARHTNTGFKGWLAQIGNYANNGLNWLIDSDEGKFELRRKSDNRVSLAVSTSGQVLLPQNVHRIQASTPKQTLGWGGLYRFNSWAPSLNEGDSFSLDPSNGNITPFIPGLYLAIGSVSYGHSGYTPADSSSVSLLLNDNEVALQGNTVSGYPIYQVSYVIRCNGTTDKIAVASRKNNAPSALNVSASIQITRIGD